ncbi:MAG: hypothetical protein WD738_16365 [Pirellulales bacterium]
MRQDATLEELRSEFDRVGGRTLSFPIAGTIAWTATGVFGAFLPVDNASIALFLCVGMIFPLSLVLSRMLREDVYSTKNELDALFMRGLIMVILVWAIAIPFWLVEASSLPLSVGVLAGLHWIVYGWIVRHWVGMFHSVTRTILVLACWFVFPHHRFVAIPAVIVVVYLITIWVLATRRLRVPLEVRKAPNQSPNPTGTGRRVERLL